MVAAGLGGPLVGRALAVGEGRATLLAFMWGEQALPRTCISCPGEPSSGSERLCRARVGGCEGRLRMLLLLLLLKVSLCHVASRVTV